MRCDTWHPVKMVVVRVYLSLPQAKKTSKVDQIGREKETEISREKRKEKAWMDGPLTADRSSDAAIMGPLGWYRRAFKKCNARAICSSRRLASQSSLHFPFV